MRSRATATVQTKIKTMAPAVRENAATHLPARTSVKVFPSRSTRAARSSHVDLPESEDPRLASVGFEAVGVAFEEDELDLTSDFVASTEELRFGPIELDAEESLVELGSAVATPNASYDPGFSTAFELNGLEGCEDPRAMRDQVVVDHLPLVRAIAIRVHENLPVHVELDDLIHAGIMGLFDASGKYNPEKKVAFSSYAKHRIKGAILDSLRQLDWASRDLRRRHKQVEQVTRDLASTLHRNPTEAEIAAKMGVEVDRWRQMMLDLRNVGLVSASTRGSEHEDLPAPDFPSKPETQPDSMCAREQLRDMLAIAMKVLPERYQRVVLLYYTNELTMKEIGTQLGINESRVSQIHKSALEKMANALQQAGIHSSQAF